MQIWAYLTNINSDHFKNSINYIKTPQMSLADKTALWWQEEESLLLGATFK